MGVDVSPVLPSAAVPYREILVKQREAAAGGTEEEEPLPDYKQFLVLCFGAVALLSKTKASAWCAAFLCASSLATMRNSDARQIVATITLAFMSLVATYSQDIQKITAAKG